MPCGASLEIGWIPVRRTVKRDEDVHAGDHVEVAVRLLPILDQPVLDEILRRELEAHGWTREADGAMTKSFGDTVATLAAGSDVVRIEVAASRTVTASATEDGRAKQEDIAAQEAIGDRAAARADARLADAREQARAALVRENIATLEAVHEQVQRELGEVTTAATKRALETRATQLGAIESSSERRTAEGGYELTIVVKT
jgi:hypothetical protein